MNKSLLQLAVLVSGSGTNLQNIMDLSKAGQLAAAVRLVVSDNREAYALKRAEHGGVKTLVLNPQEYPSRVEFDRALHQAIAPSHPDLIVLAGFMRILSAEFVDRYHNRIINIHPSLLPKYKGMNTHEKVLMNKDDYHGATVHFVTRELDAGPIILQDRIKVFPTDTVSTLKERVHQIEYGIYPRAIQLIADGKIRLNDSQSLCESKERK